MKENRVSVYFLKEKELIRKLRWEKEKRGFIFVGLRSLQGDLGGARETVR